MKRVVLHAKKQKPIILGHPWVFPKAIDQLDTSVQCGELVAVFDAGGQRVGSGVFNPNSLYRVRMLAYADKDESVSLEAMIEERLQAAIKLRQQLGLPRSDTNAFRLFNSEGDGLSGLTIDIYDDVAVVASSAYWTQANRELIETSLRKLYPLQNILWFGQTKSLQQDGWQEKDPAPVNQEVTVKLNGITMKIDFSDTQKTGLYLDQQDNQQRIAALAKDKKILDLYCYTGGFALNAAKAGATKITAVDSSPSAIQQAEANAKANNFNNIEFIQADARELLKTAGDYDMVIIDPPKVIPSRRHVHQGEQYYRFVHNELFKVMQPGTLLLTCNCSAALTKERFSQLIDQASKQNRRELRMLGNFGPSLDHPMLEHFPEGNYLHALLVAVF